MKAIKDLTMGELKKLKQVCEEIGISTLEIIKESETKQKSAQDIIDDLKEQGK